jgi:erythromycin esterase-like protein
MDIPKVVANFAGGFAVITEQLLALDKKASQYKKRARAHKKRARAQSEKLATALQQAEEQRRQLELSATAQRELNEALTMLEGELATMDSKNAKLWEENCKLRVVYLA